MDVDVDFLPVISLIPILVHHNDFSIIPLSRPVYLRPPAAGGGVRAAHAA